MAGERVPVVLVPRFTTFVGASDFVPFVLDVTAYAALELTVWRAPLVGTTPIFRVFCYESIDRVLWSECSGPQGDEPPESVETPYVWQLTSRWLRLRLALGGTNPGVTCWAQGFLVRRET